MQEARKLLNAGELKEFHWTVVAYQKGDILLSKKGNGKIIMSKHKSYKNIIF